MFKGNNRATTEINNETHYILHKTSIVIHTQKGIILSSGGRQTQTTKKALNEVGDMLGFQVFQKDFKWYVKCNRGTLDFVDGMII